jgi:hypothetical protein
MSEPLDEVGDQVKSTSPLGHEERQLRPLEPGASSFFEHDWCLMGAAKAIQTVLSQSRKEQTHE